MTVPKLAIEQALTGAQLPGRLPQRCIECRSKLHEGAPVTVLAVRNPSGWWRVDRVWGATCATHDLDDLDQQTDAPMALVEGGIAAVADTANQTHWPCLVRPEVVDCALGERVGG